MYLRCKNCNSLIADDIMEFLEIDASTSIREHLITHGYSVVVETRCRRCKMFLTIFGGVPVGYENESRTMAT